MVRKIEEVYENERIPREFEREVRILRQIGLSPEEIRFLVHEKIKNERAERYR